MNALVKLRLCTLTDQELMEKVDAATDEMSKKGKFTLNVPALPNEDYDLLVGELIYRFKDYVSAWKDDHK